MKTSLKFFSQKTNILNVEKTDTFATDQIFLMVFPWSNRKFLKQNFLFLKEKKKDNFFVFKQLQLEFPQKFKFKIGKTVQCFEIFDPLLPKLPHLHSIRLLK